VAFDRSVVGKTFGPAFFSYDWHRTSLYALASGAGTDELDLVLETRGPKVLPTFSVVPAHLPLVESLRALGGNMLTLVHGQQKCVIHRPIPPEATLSTTARVTALYDKGKGALALIETTSSGPDGEPVCSTEWGIFYRGEGGFGGDRGPEAPPYTPPEGKAPEFRIPMATRADQALIYRLASEDLNPIHSDPGIATAAGFPRPILHGLCSFGFAGRALVNALMGGDPERLVSIEGRFSKPVFPGETIATAIWPIGEGEAYFVSTVEERTEPAITLGRVTFKV
jgi:acyl dehydratase